MEYKHVTVNKTGVSKTGSGNPFIFKNVGKLFTKTSKALFLPFVVQGVLKSLSRLLTGAP
jgi:hypothetical protein